VCGDLEDAAMQHGIALHTEVERRKIRDRQHADLHSVTDSFEAAAEPPPLAGVSSSPRAAVAASTAGEPHSHHWQ